MKTKMKMRLSEAMLFIVFTASIIINHVMSEEYLIKVVTKTADTKHACGFEGYNPYFTTKITKMKHHTATLELNAIDATFVSADMAKNYGIMGSAREVYDSVKDGPWTNLTKNVADVLITDAKEHWETAFQTLKKSKLARKIGKYLAPMLKGVASFAAAASPMGPILSPVLGIVLTAMEAHTAVKTPTHQEILDATNKALAKISDDVDGKMKEAMTYAREQKAMLEKDFYIRRYTFLFTYWAECTKLIEVKAVDSCQREAYRLIVSSMDEFLLFREYLVPGKAKFQGLDDDRRRRIEVNMVSFRNYAMLSLISLKTLATTFDLERQLERATDIDSNNKTFSTCAELKLEELRIKTEARSTNDLSQVKNYSPPLKLNFYCTYREELVTKARYFERYGTAAVKEIIKLAQNRTKLLFRETESNATVQEEKTYYEPFSINTMENAKKKYVSLWNWYSHNENRTTCAGRLHPSKGVNKCQYTIDIVLKPGLGQRYNNGDEAEKKQWQKIITDKVTGNNKPPEARKVKWETTADKRQYGQGSNATVFCDNILQSRQEDYWRLEQLEISHFWIREVMKVVLCGRLLAEEEVDTCSDENLRKHDITIFEEVIKITKCAGKGIKDCKSAFDGLLSTTTSRKDGNSDYYQDDPEYEKKPSWTGELEKKVEIREIRIYIDTHEGRSHQTATARIRGGDTEADNKWSEARLVYRRRDGNFVFKNQFESANNKHKVAMTTNNGKPVIGGYIKSYVYMNNFINNKNVWYDESNWDTDPKYPVEISQFSGSYTGSFNGLKVEVGTNGMESGEWKLCKTFKNIYSQIPYIKEALTVKCEGEPVPGVNAIKITVTDKNKERELMLAEVTVIGVPSEEDQETESNPNDEVTWIHFLSAKESSENDINAMLAADTLLSTISETGKGSVNWWQGELEAEAVVQNIKLELYGMYKEVKVEVSKHENGNWIACGDVGENVDGNDIINGFERECPDGSVKYVKITSKNETSESVLKIREVMVYGRFVDNGEDGINELEKLGKEAMAKVDDEVRKRK